MLEENLNIETFKEGNGDPNILYNVKWSIKTESFLDFLSFWRKITNTKLGGTHISKHNYSDQTISQVMSVGIKDSVYQLPNRISLSNFKYGNPITSYGCILRHQKGEDIEYLLIKRINSTNYIDLIRGTYRQSNLYLMLLELPNWERERILKYSFDVLWEDLYLKEGEGESYQSSKEIFDKLRPYLEILFENFPSADPLGKNLWLFPKGKPDYKPFSYHDGINTLIKPKEDSFMEPSRLIPESGFETALREFKEETNGLELEEKYLRWEDPISENFLGSNSKNYRTNTFVFDYKEKFELNQFPKSVSPIREVSIGEIDEIKWVKLSELDKYLPPSRMMLVNFIEANPGTYPEKVKSCWKCPADLAEFCN